MKDVIEALARTIFKEVEPLMSQDRCEPNEVDYQKALVKALTEAEAKGMKLVGREPTPEMVAAVESSYGQRAAPHESFIIGDWKIAFDAAPGVKD